MLEEVLSKAWDYGFTVFGSVLTIIVLGYVVRQLWRDAKKDEEDRRKELVETHNSRIADKNAELTQVWSQLREAREEIRIIRAEKEWLERMNDRGDDMLVMMIDELRSARNAPRRSSH